MTCGSILACFSLPHSLSFSFLARSHFVTAKYWHIASSILPLPPSFRKTGRRTDGRARNSEIRQSVRSFARSRETYASEQRAGDEEEAGCCRAAWMVPPFCSHKFRISPVRRRRGNNAPMERANKLFWRQKNLLNTTTFCRNLSQH